jgi:hydrogenase maturation factor
MLFKTSGGLLACVPAQSADDAVNKMKAAGYTYSCIIGDVIGIEDYDTPVILS